MADNKSTPHEITDALDKVTTHTDVLAARLRTRITDVRDLFRLTNERSEKMRLYLDGYVQGPQREGLESGFAELEALAADEDRLLTEVLGELSNIEAHLLALKPNENPVSVAAAGQPIGKPVSVTPHAAPLSSLFQSLPTPEPPLYTGVTESTPGPSGRASKSEPLPVPVTPDPLSPLVLEQKQLVETAKLGMFTDIPNPEVGHVYLINGAIFRYLGEKGYELVQADPQPDAETEETPEATTDFRAAADIEAATPITVGAGEPPPSPETAQETAQQEERETVDPATRVPDTAPENVLTGVNTGPSVGDAVSSDENLIRSSTPGSEVVLPPTEAPVVTDAPDTQIGTVDAPSEGKVVKPGSSSKTAKNS